MVQRSAQGRRQPAAVVALVLLVLALLAASCSGAGPDDVDQDGVDGAAADDGEDGDGEAEGGGEPGGDPGAPVSATLMALAPSFDPLRHAATLQLARSWRELGIEVEVQSVEELASFFDTLRNDPDAWTAAAPGLVSRPDRLDPDPLTYPTFHSSEAGEGGSNYGAFVDDEVDRLLEEQRAALEPDERREHVHELQEVLLERVPVLPLFHLTGIYAYNQERFSGIVETPGGIVNIWTLTEAEPLTDRETFAAAYESDVESLNPLAINLDPGMTVIRLLYDTLARIGRDGEPVPWAAESWEATGPTTVEVTLRSGMTFHDGQPVTAGDVKFSLDLMRENELPAVMAPHFQPISGVEVLDDTRLEVELTQPYAPMFVTVFSQAPILPEHIWSDVVAEHDDPAEFPNDEPVGSGPFRFVSYERDTELQTERNPDHFSEPGIDFTFRAYASGDALFNAMRLEEVDANMFRFLPALVDAAEEAEHLELVQVADYGAFYIVLNLREPPFDDLAFRRALAHTVPYEQIVENVLQGYGLPGRAMIAPINEAWYNPAVDDILESQYDFDLEEARSILEEAGYSWDDDGQLRQPEG